MIWLGPKWLQEVRGRAKGEGVDYTGGRRVTATCLAEFVMDKVHDSIKWLVKYRYIFVVLLDTCCYTLHTVDFFVIFHR